MATRITKCKQADTYQAMQPPRCGCEACNQRWYAKLRAMAARQRRMNASEPAK